MESAIELDSCQSWISQFFHSRYRGLVARKRRICLINYAVSRLVARAVAAVTPFP